MSQKSPEEDRKARLAQALRENLKRRKSQARLRAAPAAAPEAEGVAAQQSTGPGEAATPLSPQEKPPKP